MKNKRAFIGPILATWKNHRKTSVVTAMLFGVGLYFLFNSWMSGDAIPQYTLAAARLGTISQTVTGSGQISASNQTDIQSQVSGTIKSINVSVGQSVRAGDLLATIDSTNAAISLENARISLAKLTQPAKAEDISNARNSVNKAYNDAFNSAATVYLDLPAIMTGMKDLLYGKDGFIADQFSHSLSAAAREYRNTAAIAYDAAAKMYETNLREFKSINRDSPTADIDKVLSHTRETIKSASTAASLVQTTITFIRNTQSDYRSTDASTAAQNITDWSAQANNNLAGLVSAQNSLQNSLNSLSTLEKGSDELDIRSARLNLEQAERTYSNYFIRAPYDGVIGRIPVNVYGQAGSGTIIATIIGNSKIANISLNEVDAAKIRNGQSVNITFDAIDGLNASGTVSEVDQVGSVSNGVVSYGVKIGITTDDPRIKPGMSVNTSIVTLHKNNVLVVPSAAIKTQGQEQYVQVFDNSVLGQATSSNPRAKIITTNASPRRIAVKTGDSDDVNTEIISGLNIGELVVTKITTTDSNDSDSTPSILSGFGARGAGSTGGTRVMTTGRPPQ